MLELDLSSQEQVRAAAAEVLAYPGPIDVLVNNAGIMGYEYGTTPEGVETHFGTNHIGHFLFTNLIMPKILAAATGARIVNVSSNLYRYSPIRFEDLGFDGGNTYQRWRAYGQSKTANMLLSLELAKRLGAKGIVSLSLHPGIIGTNLAANAGWSYAKDTSSLLELDRSLGNAIGWATPDQIKYKTLQQGTATHMFAAFDPRASHRNGGYLEDCRFMEPEEMICWARDPVDASKLWKASETIVGQSFEY